jgi:hypothetical protein
MKKFIQNFRRVILKTPAPQQLNDWQVAFVLFNCRRHYLDPEQFGAWTKEYLDQYCEEGYKRGLKGRELGQLVQGELNGQVLDMFRSLDQYGREYDHQSEKSTPANALHELVGFDLEVKASSIPNAGDGVFVKDGYVPPGTGFYLHIIS